MLDKKGFIDKLVPYLIRRADGEMRFIFPQAL